MPSSSEEPAIIISSQVQGAGEEAGWAEKIKFEKHFF